MDQAKKFYEMYENEEPYAVYSLGRMYEEGNDPDGDGRPDMAKAYRYYEKAR
jgi:TPR repeat protein